MSQDDNSRHPLLTFARLLLLLTVVFWGAGRLACFAPRDYVSICLGDISLLLFGIVTILADPPVILRKLPFKQPLLLFSAVALFSWLASLRLFAPSQVVIGGLYLVRWLAFALLPFGILSLRSRDVDFNPTDYLFLGAAIVAVAGFLQLLFFPDFSFLAPEGWDPHYYRMASTFLDPNFAGGLFCLALFLILSKDMATLSKRDWLFGILFYTALLFTFSRSSYGFFVIGSAALAFMHRNRSFSRLMFVAIIILFAAWMLRFHQESSMGVSRTQSNYARIESWLAGIHIIQKHPWIGVGFNNYRYAIMKYKLVHHAIPKGWRSGAGNDSSLIFVWATTGFFGFLSFLWLIYSLTRIGSAGNFGIALTASIPGLLFHSTFVNSLFYPPILGWLLILGATASWHAQEHSSD